MSRVFLIRHAEPAAAWGGVDNDPGLSELGREQAAATAQALAAFGPLAVVSSPMLRCRETAAPFALGRGVEPHIEPRVSEVVAPVGTADRRAWLRETFPWADGVARRPWGEVDASLHAWRDDALAALIAMEQDTAVFTHFIAINAIASAVLERDETIVFRPAHASITEFEVTHGAARLVRLGAEMNSEDVR